MPGGQSAISDIRSRVICPAKSADAAAELSSPFLRLFRILRPRGAAGAGTSEQLT